MAKEEDKKKEEKEKTMVDNGFGIDMHETIEQLMESERYDWNPHYKEGNNAALYRTTVDNIRATFKDVSFNPVKSNSAAIPESVVQTFDGVDFQHDKPNLFFAQSTPGNKLLSYPNFVEAPTIILDFNGIKIGGFNNRGDKYPNYINSMSINKINGRINQYIINLKYQVRLNEDPNFIDKLLNRTGYTNPFKILYGDSANPELLFNEESAIITNVKHKANPTDMSISYTISALSSNVVSEGTYKNFTSKSQKPSTAIYDLLYNSGNISIELQTMFPGMKNKNTIFNNGLIPTTDEEIQLGGINDVSVLSYLSYLVSCMRNPNSPTSTYYLTYLNDNENKYGGAYFKVTEVKGFNTNNYSIEDTNLYSDLYEIDVGFPGSNFVTDFKISSNDYWSLVYEYNSGISEYEYDIDSDGNEIKNKTNSLYINNKFNSSSVIDTNWWKHVTEFPITARITLKGLVKPIMLMTYIKINAVFYGQKDVASGIYVVTAQDDLCSGNGYTTTLTMLRVAGDNITVNYGISV